MSNSQKILDSFSIKDTLNPKVWEHSEDPKKATMVPKVRKALMRIAEEFIDDLGEDVFVEDSTRRPQQEWIIEIQIRGSVLHHHNMLEEPVAPMNE